MLNRRFFLELAALVGASIVCALVSNAIAARERQIALVGDYPRAMQVTQRTNAPTTAPIESPVSIAPPLATVQTTTAPSPVVTPVPVTASPQIPQTVPASAATPPAAKPEKSFPPHPDKAWVEISGEDARELWERKAIVIDARRSSEYETGHIAGAISIPVWEGDADERVGQLAMRTTATDAPVIVYCSGGNCEDSHMLAEKLFGVGFNNVLVYRDGFPDWQQRGGATERGR